MSPMKSIIEKLFSLAPQPEGESARIRAIVDPEQKLPWMEAQVTIQGGATFGGLLTTFGGSLKAFDSCLRLITPQATKGGSGVILVDQYISPDAVIAVAKLLDPPRVTPASNIILG